METKVTIKIDAQAKQQLQSTYKNALAELLPDFITLFARVGANWPKLPGQELSSMYAPPAGAPVERSPAKQGGQASAPRAAGKESGLQGMLSGLIKLIPGGEQAVGIYNQVKGIGKAVGVDTDQAVASAMPEQAKSAASHVKQGLGIIDQLKSDPVGLVKGLFTGSGDQANPRVPNGQNSLVEKPVGFKYPTSINDILHNEVYNRQRDALPPSNPGSSLIGKGPTKSGDWAKRPLGSEEAIGPDPGAIQAFSKLGELIDGLKEKSSGFSKQVISDFTRIDQNKDLFDKAGERFKAIDTALKATGGELTTKLSDPLKSVIDSLGSLKKISQAKDILFDWTAIFTGEERLKSTKEGLESIVANLKALKELAARAGTAQGGGSDQGASGVEGVSKGQKLVQDYPGSNQVVSKKTGGENSIRIPLPTAHQNGSAAGTVYNQQQYHVYVDGGLTSEVLAGLK